MSYLQLDNGKRYDITIKGMKIKTSDSISEDDFALSKGASLYLGDGEQNVYSYENPVIQIIEKDDSETTFKIFSNSDKFKTTEYKNTQIDTVLKIISQSFSSEQAMMVKDLNVYPVYSVGVVYKKDTYFTYNGDLYKVLQEHTSQPQWIPGETGTESLYLNIHSDDSGYRLWSQPTGAHDAYNIGDIVNYNGTLYKSLINGNVWSPDVYPSGWEMYSESSQPEGYPDFVQPTGAHDAYKKGDIVKYNGTLYRSLIDGNVYSPDAYPQGWEVYTEE